MRPSPVVRLIGIGAGFVLLSCAGFGADGSDALADALSVQATELGQIATNPDILGRDGGYSALFQGHSVWLYADTFLGKPDVTGRNFISNTLSYTDSLNAAEGITGFKERLDSVGSPTMVLAETAAEQSYNLAHYGDPCKVQPCGVRWAIWPSSIVTDPKTNQALVFYMVVSAAPGDFNFQGIGNSVAIWKDFGSLPQRPVLKTPAVPAHPDLLFTETEPNFGSAAVFSGGTLYVYGCGLPKSGLDKGCRIAKVDPSTVQDRSTWQFCSGNGKWTSSASDAVSVFSGGSILSVSWNAFLQRYVAVYSVPFSQDVDIRTAPAPEGPWSPALLAFHAVSPSQGHTYDAHAHSEFDADGGQTIYVTYSRILPKAFSSEVRLVALKFQIKSALP